MESIPSGKPKRKRSASPKAFFFRSWMIGQLRRIFKRYPPYYLTLRAVRIESNEGTFKNGKVKIRVYYPCRKCSQPFKSSEIVVDHIEPVIDPKVGFPLLPDGSDDWKTYIGRLFCPIENLQPLCYICHDLKTGKETKARVRNRKKRQEKVDNS
jgi:5-methylcytosine-specific restriction endonuclease McrA